MKNCNLSNAGIGFLCNGATEKTGITQTEKRGDLCNGATQFCGMCTMRNWNQRRSTKADQGARYLKNCIIRIKILSQDHEMKSMLRFLIKSIILGMKLSPCHGLDLDQMIYKKPHTQPEALSPCQNVENTLGFQENRHISKKDCDPAPDLTGVNRRICVIPNQVYDSPENRTERKRIDRSVRFGARHGYSQKSRMFQKKIRRTVTEWLRLIRFPKDRTIPILDLMSSNYVGSDLHESKGSEELGMLNKYTTTPIRINQ